MDTSARLTAFLLILGETVFLIGAVFWRMYFQQSLKKTLPVIVERRTRWLWIHSWMIPGVILTALALFMLRELMRTNGETSWSTLMAILFLIGTVPMLCMLTFRITVMDQAATAFARTGVMTEIFEWLHQWTIALYALHMVLSYLASFFLGLAALSAGIFPAWFAWASMGFGGVGALGFILMRGGPFSPPFLVHVIPLLAGILLLVI